MSSASRAEIDEFCVKGGDRCATSRGEIDECCIKGKIDECCVKGGDR